MRYTVRPISDRTPFTGRHEWTPFRATWDDTRKLLDRELEHLEASNVVLEVDVTEGNIRLDGMLRADAKVASPAVRVAFDSRHGPLTYATDRFRGRYTGGPADWQENVRAIALGLEALRKVDRYGITRRGEQYAGWKALPSGASATAMPAGMSREEAWELLCKAAGMDATDAVYQPPEVLHRRARAGAHPDRHGGDQTRWDQVETAARVVGVLS